MKKYLKYLITFLIGLLTALFVCIGKDIFKQDSAKAVFHILSDAFLLPGVYLSGLGLLVIASNEGTFDMLVYGLRSFISLFRSVPLNKKQTFYEYRESKAKNKMGYWFLLIIGLFYLVVTIIMYLIFNTL